MAGMLFVYESPRRAAFWMRNTRVPLDIAFLGDDGTVLNILGMKPLDDGPRYRSAGPARFALEMNAGWFERHGVRPGDAVEIPESVRAIPSEP